MPTSLSFITPHWPRSCLTKRFNMQAAVRLKWASSSSPERFPASLSS